MRKSLIQGAALIFFRLDSGWRRGNWWTGLLLTGAMALLLAPSLRAQQSETCLIIPFDNHSPSSNLDWLGEGFAESMRDALQNAGVSVLSRQERTAAFDQAGIPLLPTLSLATLMHVADDADAHWLILGSYQYDGQVFRASARVIDLQREHMTTIPARQGALQDLQAIQAGLARSVLRAIAPHADAAAASAAVQRVSLPAYENYVRAVLTTVPRVRFNYLRQAVRLQPDYSRAIYRLGQWYFQNGDYATALLWLPRVSRADSDYWQSQFLAGRAAWRLQQYTRSAAFFREIADRMPMTEVLNNLGVALAHLHPDQAVPILQRARQQDPGDATVERNLALATALAGHPHTALQLLAPLEKGSPSPAVLALRAALQPPQGTAPNSEVLLAGLLLKSDFPADSFRQLEAAIVQFDASKAQSMSARKQVQFHLQQGRQFLEKGALDGAEKEFRAALSVDANSPDAEVGLAQVALARHDWTTAAHLAQQALRNGPAPDAHLVLARVLLVRGDTIQARHEVATVLQDEPGNADARALAQQMDSTHR